MEFKERIIGKVSATEKNPSTTDGFYFWTNEDEILSPFDIVKVQQLPDDNPTTTYAIVQEVSHVTDSPSHFASFVSNDFGNLVKEENIGNMDRLGMNYVKAQVITNTDDIYMPVLNGRQVYLCNVEDIQMALGLRKDDENGLVCGYLSMYKGKENLSIPVELNYHFLIGNDGAHLNISGISGLAAKTSYTMFLMNAIQQKLCIEQKQDIAFVIFNVKTRDLLAIDEKNNNLKKKDQELYDLLTLKQQPFQNVTYYYPFNHNTDRGYDSFVDDERYSNQRSSGKAYRYYLPYKSCKEKLDLLFSTEDDGSGTMESCVRTIMNDEDNFDNVEQWETLKAEVNRKKQQKNSHSDILTVSWRKFSRILNKYVVDDGIFNDTEESDKKDLTNTIYNVLKGGDVMVLDIAKLDDNTQNFVFSSVVKDIYDMKFGGERTSDVRIPDKVIIFVDELNKFASRELPKNSPILKNLLDVTERGRSQGVILFAAEQFRSAIFDRVKGNCSTNAYGRTNSVEISKPDYQYIPSTYKNMMTRLPAGEYIISNPALRSLVKIKFPYNLYKVL